MVALLYRSIISVPSSCEARLAAAVGSTSRLNTLISASSSVMAFTTLSRRLIPVRQLSNRCSTDKATSMSRERIRKISSFKRDERGLQLVELAIVLPVLVLLFAAAAEFGRYFYEYTTLAKGTRVAVRYLATAKTNGDDETCAQN